MEKRLETIRDIARQARDCLTPLRSGALFSCQVSCHRYCYIGSGQFIICFADLQSRPQRMALPDCPAPASQDLEAAYYFNAADIAERALSLIGE